MGLVRDVIAHADLAVWAELALIAFMVAFIAVVVWLYVVRRPADFKELEMLPLEDDTSSARVASPDRPRNSQVTNREEERR